MRKNRSIILVVILFFLFLTPVSARAGGGGGSGGSSGGTSGGEGGSPSSSSSDNPSTPVEYFVNLIPVFLFLSIGSVPVIFYRYRIYKKSHMSKHLLKELDDTDAFWDEDYLQQQIEEIYYTAQSCWAEKNMEPLHDYLSDELYENWRMKLDWMDVRNERNILNNIKLLSAQVVSVYDSKMDEHDMFWAAIRGKMVDYTINEEDDSIIEGDKRSHEFYEYWKFIRKNDSFVLDEVRQKDEVDVDAFVNLSEEHDDENDGSSLRYS